MEEKGRGRRRRARRRRFYLNERYAPPPRLETTNSSKKQLPGPPAPNPPRDAPSAGANSPAGSVRRNTKHQENEATQPATPTPLDQNQTSHCWPLESTSTKVPSTKRGSHKRNRCPLCSSFCPSAPMHPSSGLQIHFRYVFRNNQLSGGGSNNCINTHSRSALQQMKCAFLDFHYGQISHHFFHTAHPR